MTMPGSPQVSGPRQTWGETWRVLVAAGYAVIAFIMASDPAVGLYAREPIWWVEMLCLPTALILLLLRRRWPLVIALILCVMAAVSYSAGGAEAIALISLATHRRWGQMAIAAVASMFGSQINTAIYMTDAIPNEAGRSDLLPFAALELGVNLLLNLLLVALIMAVGVAIGSRRDLMTSLRERAELSDRERASREEQARAAERTRIAREMHDVIAHRISLVAMHAGALAYRKDLSSDEITAEAILIHDSARTALNELRDVLGALREPSTLSSEPEAPQPTLAGLEALLENERAGGTPVEVGELPDLTGLPTSISRNAYRIIQEALTNARKHAQGQPVQVAISGSPGNGLELVVSNPIGEQAPLPASGFGLTGLAERVALCEGKLSHGVEAGAFVLRAWLPWKA